MLAYKTRANVKSECKPQRKQYIDVVVVADVDETDGVDGGVCIPPKALDPFGEPDDGNGDGILYLINIKNVNKILNINQ